MGRAVVKPPIASLPGGGDNGRTPTSEGGIELSPLVLGAGVLPASSAYNSNNHTQRTVSGGSAAGRGGGIA